MYPSPMQTESSWLYRPMCRAGFGCTLGCVSLFMCALPVLPVVIEFLSILDLKLVVVPAEELGMRGVERKEVRFDALRGKGNGGDHHIGETVEWGERIGFDCLNLYLFIKITNCSSCIFKICFGLPCGFLLWQSLPFHKEGLLSIYGSFLLYFFNLVFFISVYYLRWWSGSFLFLSQKLGFCCGF